jgi:hypothetical protein
MYCRFGNVTRDALIGYIEPITTGAPLSFEAADAEPDAAPDVAPDVADDPDAPELLLELEQAEAAAASATHARPAARRGHFFVAIGVSPPYAERRHTHSFSGHSYWELFQGTLFLRRSDVNGMRALFR